MDLFTKEPGPLYVPAFAGRLLLAMAKGIARATDRIKGAFMDEDAEGMWTLAMVVVQWYADNLPASEAGVVASTLQEFSVSAIASNLNFFRDRLLPFVRTAHQARSDAQLGFNNVVRALRVRYVDGQRQALDYEALVAEKQALEQKLKSLGAAEKR